MRIDKNKMRRDEVSDILRGYFAEVYEKAGLPWGIDEDTGIDRLARLILPPKMVEIKSEDE